MLLFNVNVDSFCTSVYYLFEVLRRSTKSSWGSGISLGPAKAQSLITVPGVIISFGRASHESQSLTLALIRETVVLAVWWISRARASRRTSRISKGDMIEG